MYLRNKRYVRFSRHLFTIHGKTLNRRVFFLLYAEGQGETFQDFKDR